MFSNNLFQCIRHRLYAKSCNLKNSENSSALWVVVPGYAGIYEVNSIGEVRCMVGRNAGKSLTQKLRRSYLSVKVSNSGQTKTTYVHRIVALAFVPNPAGKPIVNHKNGIKTDNRAENLEWVFHSENIKHAYDSNLLIPSNTRRVIDCITSKIYNSIRDAAKEIGVNYSTCKNMLCGYNKDNGRLRYL